VSVRLPDGALIETRIDKSSLPASQSFKVGIRAECVEVCAPGAGNTVGMAQFVERHGDRTLIYVRLADGTTAVAEDAGDSRVRLNDPVGLKFNGGAAHLFDDRDLGHHAVIDEGA
jgi:multiple sugar transport system ATP-binding protein